MNLQTTTQVDVQVCNIKLESWGYLESKLKFQWHMDGNDIAKGLNDTLNQHYFNVEYVGNTGSEYAGIADGKFSIPCLILMLKYNYTNRYL